MPQVSICIPVYNGENYLKECLNSILNQTFKDFELVISDDKSIDGSVKIIKEFLRKNSWIESRLVLNEKRGIGDNWNNCIRNSSGKYIKFLFQDDVLAPTCLEEMLKILEGNNRIGLVASKREFLIEPNKMNDIGEWVLKYSNLQVQFNESNEGVTVINKSLFKQDFFLHSPMNKIGEPSVVMFRKTLINKVGYFRTDLVQVLDYEYWYRILKHYEIAIINKPLVNFRLHPQQATNLNRIRDIQDYSIYRKIIFFNYFFLISNSLRRKLFFNVTWLGRIILKFYKWTYRKKASV